MPRTLTIHGLAVSADFPVNPYESVYAKVSTKWPTHPFYEQFSGAWNAVVYRYCGAQRAGEAFDKSLAEHGTSPNPEHRSCQEHMLFDFFSSGFSVFESMYYAAFAVGAIIDPQHFALATANDQQRVSPRQTIEAFRRAFVGDNINQTFSCIDSHPAYLEWREIRNILTHRTAPGRKMYVSIGSDQVRPTEWKLNNIVLDKTLVKNRFDQLSMLLSRFTNGLDVFLKKHV